MEQRQWHGRAAGVGFTLAAATSRGPRAENQDNLLVILPDAAEGGRAWRLAGEHPLEEPVAGWPDHAVRLAVMDGMGGHADGRLASEALAAALAAAPFQREPAGLRDVVRGLHAALRQRLPGPDDRRGGSTLVVIDLDLATGLAVRLHVGDSRGYLWHRDGWHRLTRDHRGSEFMRRDGDLSAADYAALGDGTAGYLAQAVGFGSRAVFARTERTVNPALRLDLAEDLEDGLVGHADVARLRVGPGDRLLLATDGLLGRDAGAGLLAALAAGAAGVPGSRGLGAVVTDARICADDNLTGVLLVLEPEETDRDGREQRGAKEPAGCGRN